MAKDGVEAVVAAHDGSHQDWQLDCRIADALDTLSAEHREVVVSRDSPVRRGVAGRSAAVGFLPSDFELFSWNGFGFGQSGLG